MEYHKEGNLRLGKHSSYGEILRELEPNASCGLDVKMIDGKEVREINPFLGRGNLEPAGAPQTDMQILF